MSDAYVGANLLTVVKDMGLTRAQFFRDIGLAMRGIPYRIEDQQVIAGTADHGITISLRELPPRRLSALMVLPRCEVSIAFEGYDDQERAAFLAQFDLAYQRGGG